MRRLSIALILLSACATAPKPQVNPETHGMASWYGQEFAGRTTANGEIFDPMLFTAAHRTLPFGTVVDVQNVKTQQSVRVRINDRGPYIGGRMIDLSYAAAQQVGLIEPGSGEVDLSIVKMGNGEREPPAPYIVTIPDAPSTIPVIVDAVQVVEEHHGVETRVQVSKDGRRLEEVPLKPVSKKFVVQVGAFALEANAKELLAQLTHIGQSAYIDSGPLYRVRIGPFDTREQAIQARARLETAGLSAIVVAQ
jgi:rare lipoprotein A